MLSSRKTAAPANGKLYVEDVFSTYLYTGTGSSQTITNGIDLAGKGGLTWFKSRGTTNSHYLIDSARNGGGLAPLLSTDNANAQNSSYTGTSFNSFGFSHIASSALNVSGFNYASWTFRKAAKFFDVVTYTGDGVAAPRAINHSLGVAPGCIMIKQTSGAGGNWYVYHVGAGNTSFLVLNATSAAYTGQTIWNSQTPSSTQFYMNNSSAINVAGETYVAYLFAHDAAADGIIQCGSVTANQTVSLGWEPQWVLFKDIDSAYDNWVVVDNMRGFSQTQQMFLFPNNSSADTETGGWIVPTATGFSAQSSFNAHTYIYIAIRRPMKVPTSGTSVFAPVTSSGSTGGYLTTGFPVDYQLLTDRNDGSYRAVIDRLRGVSTLPSSGYSPWLSTNITTAETASNYFARGWDNTGFRIPNYGSGISGVYYNFRRAPGFFDVVCYTGTGAARTVNHNLGVAPELVIVKSRSNARNWAGYAAPLGAGYNLSINSTVAAAATTSVWDNTAPTSTAFSVSTATTNNWSGENYVAYLFASCPGVSKVGSYTGNGSSQTINCGFAAGARFVMIKRTDSTGDWYVWDTARGIVSGNDPHLSLNTTAAEVTGDDTIDPDSAGFIVNQVSATNVNVNGASYIYLAIA